jgi:hypothetical protein
MVNTVSNVISAFNAGYGPKGMKRKYSLLKKNESFQDIYILKKFL